MHTILRRIKNPYRTAMGQERLDSLSLLCIDADMLRSVDFEDVIKDFALAKSRKRTFLNCVGAYCITIANVCNRVAKRCKDSIEQHPSNETLACESLNNIDALHSKRCIGLHAILQ